MNGELPWLLSPAVLNRDERISFQETKVMKMSYHPGSYNNIIKMPDQMREFAKYIYSLEFEQQPNYDYLKRCLESTVELYYPLVDTKAPGFKYKLDFADRKPWETLKLYHQHQVPKGVGNGGGAPKIHGFNHVIASAEAHGPGSGAFQVPTVSSIMQKQKKDKLNEIQKDRKYSVPLQFQQNNDQQASSQLNKINSRLNNKRISDGTSGQPRLGSIHGTGNINQLQLKNIGLYPNKQLMNIAHGLQFAPSSNMIGAVTTNPVSGTLLQATTSNIMSATKTTNLKNNASDFQLGAPSLFPIAKFIDEVVEEEKQSGGEESGESDALYPKQNNQIILAPSPTKGQHLHAVSGRDQKNAHPSSSRSLMKAQESSASKKVVKRGRKFSNDNGRKGVAQLEGKGGKLQQRVKSSFFAKAANEDNKKAKARVKSSESHSRFNDSILEGLEEKHFDEDAGQRAQLVYGVSSYQVNMSRFIKLDHHQQVILDPGYLKQVGGSINKPIIRQPSKDDQQIQYENHDDEQFQELFGSEMSINNNISKSSIGQSLKVFQAHDNQAVLKRSCGGSIRKDKGILLMTQHGSAQKDRPAA
ncbi:hypothetical protein FGO68_gene14595 [Halteria grandinella]|uniref:Uncharacterized protein n=1 Tax=Halteria grandinella TaxID=5974 RepID=A0A8J8P4I5_HALGN|nr:hypothetical protein FGO68_gene14595 [Halteria grandinella]